MLRKTANSKGFTIIEVVITIAIGAAVMALVLNAVQGARRSQRNQARVNDVGLIAGAINNYYSSRNALPDEIGDIDDSIVDKLSYYPDASGTIAANFDAEAWVTGKTITDGTFFLWGGTPAAGNANVNTNTPAAAAQLGSTTKNTDQMAIIRQASCNSDFSQAQAGGIREIVIVYLLEGDDTIVCREI